MNNKQLWKKILGYKVGDRVKIVGHFWGGFEGSIGPITKVEDNRKYQVKVKSDLTLEVDEEEIELIG